MNGTGFVRYTNSNIRDARGVSAIAVSIYEDMNFISRATLSHFSSFTQNYHHIHNWGNSGLSSWSTSLLCLHGIASCSHLRLSNRHFLLDEGPSSSTQPCPDRTAVVPSNPSFHHNFTIQLDTSKTARNLGVVTDDQLTFSDHIAKTAWSCRFALFIIRKIRSFLSEHASQLLVQSLVPSRLDYCNAFLAGRPASSIKPLQLIQNAAARIIFNEPKRTHVTPLFINLHWLPTAAHMKLKALMFAYKTTTGSAPLYLNSLLQTYVSSRSLHSASERGIIVHPKEAQNHSLIKCSLLVE
ncbi:putative RNA-directed DNA polymerase from transposon BS [Labeo rohita]|uniref:RNA-directed DNA polymerase from transposon BS n=1 Tax=Labeo rohita TaxID=84645 RepID=A0ABQ8M395_LABRO|nr:putative RNA-directed DNA polymerase from transposon BS [Labeo rohita]